MSCDSLQVYRGLDIGSAKATPEERAAVPHHLIDVADPGEAFSAADYARLAREALDGIRSRGRLPIVAGGTGLYLRALLHGLFAGPSRDAGLRGRLEGLAERFGDERLHRVLARVDPEAAARIAPRDRVRVVRALEVYRATGRTITEGQRLGARAAARLRRPRPRPRPRPRRAAPGGRGAHPADARRRPGRGGAQAPGRGARGTSVPSRPSGTGRPWRSSGAPRPSKRRSGPSSPTPCASRSASGRGSGTRPTPGGSGIPRRPSWPRRSGSTGDHGAAASGLTP